MPDNGPDIAFLEEKLDSLEKENYYLRQELKLLKHKLFGSKSEKLDDSQLLLAMETLEELEQAPGNEEEIDISYRRKKKNPKVARHKIPEHIEKEVTEIIPEEVKADPESYEYINSEESKRLDLIPAKLINRITIRHKYKKKDELDAVPFMAPLPPQLIDNGLAATGLLVHVILSKYVDHLPLYRQEQIFKSRFNITLSRNTMSDWIKKVSLEWLSRIYEGIRTDLLSQSYLQGDETVIPYRDPDKKGKTKNGYLWIYSSPTGNVLFEWSLSRAMHVFENFIDGFEGLFQSDGYQVYDSIGRKHGLTLLGCWAHARRKFHDAYKVGEMDSVWFLLKIKQLYAIETQIHEEKLDAKEIRCAQSLPLLQEIKTELLKQAPDLDPRDKQYLAINYCLNQWDKLVEFVNYSQSHIDNNMAERGVRPTKLGVKNWLFIGSPNAGKRAAIIYTIVESCKRHRINPQEYLNDVLTKMLTMTNHQFDDANLLPHQWKQSYS